MLELGEKNIFTEEYDLIVVGTGVGGCYSVLNSSENKKILMITKAKLEESDSYLAQGGICVLRDEKDYDSFFQDTMKAGHYKNNRDSVKEMIENSPKIIEDLVSYGVDFKKVNGKFAYTREGAHSKARILYHEDITGKEITRKLLKNVKKRENTLILENTTLVDIISNDNACYGAILKDTKNKIHRVYSKNVILACGGIGGNFENSTNYPHLTGDGIKISEKNNIKLKNLDYIQVHPTTLYSKSKGRRFLISESVRGEGALLYNAQGNRFVDELMPRDYVTKEILAQMEKDNSKHVWLDMRPIKKRGINLEERFPNILKKCKEEGYDPNKELIPVVPAQHYFMGGIEVDLNSKTSMSNLYAVGETSCNGVHGENRLASNSLLETLVFSRNAIRNIENKTLTQEGK
ncbi:L-aspartate oxidase [Fusobacterium sp. IOR10]|uniref:L-aspartate oxidase n=1 Tax=Fusobacterium sp. IOR10 TaxID=2665157 RepID=UPI00193FEF06